MEVQEVVVKALLVVSLVMDGLVVSLVREVVHLSPSRCTF